jgi:AbrB family looped-hinge helix DNA binding protein
MPIMTITSKNQLTIPMSLMRELNLSPGKKIRFVKQGNEIVLKPEFVSQRGVLAKYAKNAEGKDFSQIRKEAWAKAMKEKYERYAKEENN